MKRGTLIALLLSLVGVGGIWTADAVTLTSPSYSVNGNLGDSAAGTQSSTNYSLTSAAGESIAGPGSSKSYKLGQGYLPTLENSMQVVTQPNGLVAYWPFEDVTPDGSPALDESQNSNNGIYSTSSVSTTGKVGNAWSTFNNNQFINVPHSASIPTSGASMTISGWIYKTGGTDKAIITKWDFGSSNGSWGLQTTSTGANLRMFIRDGTGDSGANYVDTTNGAIATNTWQHVAAVYDGSQSAANRVRIYIDGSQASTTMGGTIPASLTNSTSPLVMADFPGLTRLWQGSLDEMKIYSRSLTAQEIKAEYAAGNAGLSSGLSLNSVTPGVSQTASFDSIVQTSAGGYTLSINQNNNLTSGGFTIPGVTGSIASPLTWSEGTTKGLGFTLYGTNATSIPGTWNSGLAYAALPASATSFYTRSNYTGGVKDVLNMRLRLDTQTTQVSGDYTNQMIITGTMIP